MSATFKIVGISTCDKRKYDINRHKIIENTKYQDIRGSIDILEKLLPKDSRFSSTSIKAKNKRVFSVVGIMDMSKTSDSVSGNMEISMGRSFDSKFIKKISAMVKNLN